MGRVYLLLAVCLLVAGFAGPNAGAGTDTDTGIGKKPPVQHAPAPATAASISLKTTCPAGFERTEGGVCRFVSLYQLYPSIQDSGVGGLKSGLPVMRDGYTAMQTDLGRYLFFDPLLSRDKTLSCATCHDPDKGFADGQPVSIGTDGKAGTRSAPSLWNVGFLEKLFWDERATSLEEQVQGPLYAPQEMANTPEQLLADINAVPVYRALFAEAFGGTSADAITLDQIYTALAAFEVSLVSFNSRYDQYAHGYHSALTGSEIEGLNLFRSFVARCSECHTPPLFTNGESAVIGVAEPDGMPRDIGIEATYGDPTMRGAFKVPTLRNIALSAPYMHAGQFKDLRSTVKFYNDGRGHAVPVEEKLRIHWHIWEPELKPQELDRLVDFLHTLTDESMKPVVPTMVPSGLPLVTAEAFRAAATAEEDHKGEGS